MNSPESNEALAFQDKPDKFDELSAVFCRLGIERLLEEARVLNQLNETEEGGVKVSAEITSPDEAHQEDKIARELVEINATIDDGFQRYGVKHALYVRSKDAEHDLYMLRLYEFVFSADTSGSKKTVFNADFSSTSVQLNHIKAADGVSGLYNEGGPLSPDEYEIFKELKMDAKTVQDHQFFEVKNLMLRVLDSVRAQA